MNFGIAEECLLENGSCLELFVMMLTENESYVCAVMSAIVRIFCLGVRNSHGSAVKWFRPMTKVCSLLEWSFIISIDTSWDWFQRTYVLITAGKNL